MGRYKVDYEAGDLIPLEEVMVGATSSTAGIGGIVPSPAAHYQSRLLGGDGTWQKANFVGTKKEWNSLSFEDKLQFKTADIYKKQCTITYKANNGSEVDIVETILEGSKYTISTNSFTPPVDMMFGYWNTKQDGSGINYKPGDEIVFDDDLTLWAVWDWVALKFSSDDDFTLSVATPGWLEVSNPGTIEYSLNNGTNWSTWDGSELSGTVSQPIYLRGTGNTKITGSTDAGYKWTFTGKYVTGNIETLLDYEIVANGGYLTMGDYCYSLMFGGCTSLVTAPSLSATTLAEGCYYAMFSGCTSLVIAPQLPATILRDGCYYAMFGGCTSLVTAPSLPATTLAESCYYLMFYECTSLTTVPQLPAITLRDGCYTEMFRNCSVKISTTPTSEYRYAYRIPMTGTGMTADFALECMFMNTGGEFKGTPTINTTYYTDHQPV